jgi:hypothetical protein
LTFTIQHKNYIFCFINTEMKELNKTEERTETQIEAVAHKHGHRIIGPIRVIFYSE